MDFLISISEIMKENHEKQTEDEKKEPVEIIFVISNQYLIPEYKKTITRNFKKNIKYIND